MSGKLVFITGLLGVGGYVGHKMSQFDPTVFPYSKEQVETMLVNAKTTLPRRDGDGTINIWGVDRTSKGVKLNMRYASDAPLIECDAVVTEIDANQTKVVPDCAGDLARSDDAIERTTAELRVPMFEEHIQATMNKRPFNRQRVDMREAGTVMRNMKGMQREAMKRSDEMQAMEAESQH